MEPIEIIKKYYDSYSKAYSVLVAHSKSVAKKALDIAKKNMHLNPDLKFIEEAAMLHDIGFIKTDVPEIGCHGDKPYIFHGVLGREILEKEGLPRHALVCERHIGVGLTVKDIEEQNLGLPKRDMSPVSVEEKIICLADKFFTKLDVSKELAIDEIKAELAKYGHDKVERFEELMKLFGC